jgi:hypothetical protein
LANRSDDENAVSHRFADALLATSNEIIAGERESDVIDAAVRLLNLSESEARDHYAILRDPTTGFVASGRVDRASIATLVDLRRAYSPTPELDEIMDRLDTVAMDGVLE